MAPDEILGRDDFIEELWEILGGRNIYMNDLRRIGKTIFFRKMESTASDNWLVSKRDLGGVKTAEEFATRVYRDRLYLLTAKDGLMSWCDLWDLQAKSYPQLELQLVCYEQG